MYLNRFLSEEDTQTSNKHMKICSTSLITREMQIKTTLRYHFSPTRMDIMKKTENKKVGEDVEKLEPLCTIGVWSYTSTMEYDVANSPKLIIELLYNLEIPLLDIYIYTKKIESRSIFVGYICTPMLIATLFFIIA